ncbi:unnamed protein product [Euphydryas editha]|uniref:C2H2-type domain-containing protein n=1 Tax=Euphydryas editha TaxID=104508 RepID=A0AAU9TDC2_EUPED|nr:unnamed protein product [Euphydryas editha]
MVLNIILRHYYERNRSKTKNLKPFQCKFCDYACRDSSTLRKHEERHMGISRRYQCKMCDKSYKTKSVLKDHIAEAHLDVNVKNRPCDECGKMFKSNKTLATHIKLVHEKIYSCKCDICGVEISNKYNMAAHLTKHVHFKPFKCSFDGCTKRFKDKSTLKKHSIIHYPDKQFTCSLCERRFTRIYRLKKHMKQHQFKRKTVVCDYCGTSFYNKNYLKNHITKKHCVREKFICDYCGLLTYNKPSIVMHIKYGHGSEHDRQCKICKKNFKMHKYLKLHYWNTHCIKYNMAPRKPKQKKRKIIIKEETKEVELLHEVKVEPLSDSDPDTKIKDERNEKTKKQAIRFEDFFIEHIMKPDNNLRAKIKIKPVNNSQLDEIYNNLIVEEKIGSENRNIKDNSLGGNDEENNESSAKSLENDRQDNDDGDNFVENNDSNDPDYVNENDRSTQSKRIKINTHQCYVCFKLYETKDKLIDHCQEHFDVCNINMLKKCPLCDYVTKLNLPRHMLMVHKINIKIPYANIKDRKNNNNGSRFYYNVDNEKISEIEIIPSIKNLNRRAYIELDKRKREINSKSITKTKLVKKQGEWIVEKVKIDAKSSDIVLPKIEDSDYLGKMKLLYMKAKNNGQIMMFPCNKCDKICQTLSALKLHMRKHDPNPKPYRKKVWKHKLTEDQLKKINEKPIYVNPNRYEKPKPIINRHKCDPKLKEFYETNIQGGDIEFWHFLKIFNRMSRENINDFSDLENRKEYGIHFSLPAKDALKVENERDRKRLKESKKQVKYSFKRKIMISKRDHERRKAMIDVLRRNLYENNVDN